MKNVDKKKTLAYAVAFYFDGKVDFLMGNKKYQHINTVYDEREDGRGFNTVEIVYDYKAMKYAAWCVDEKLGNKEITIL